MPKEYIWVTHQNLNEIAGMPRDTVFRAWKASYRDGTSPHFPIKKPRLVCASGKTLAVKNASMDVNETCAAGVNVATLRWAVAIYNLGGYKYWVVEFTGRDIAAVPARLLGKFRVFSCRVIRGHGLKYVTRLIEGNYAEAGKAPEWRQR